MAVALHVNIDHVATLRQARRAPYPDPIQAAKLCKRSGADGITVHLREDRRHIQDHDVRALRKLSNTFLNLEIAPVESMVRIAENVKPDMVTFVPERREEITTEHGLDVCRLAQRLEPLCTRLCSQGMITSLFIDATQASVQASIDLGVNGIELHTGEYANAKGEPQALQLQRLKIASEYAVAQSPRLRIAAGHGLTIANVQEFVQQVTCVEELNIGHALISDAVFVGLEKTVQRFRQAIAAGEKQR